MRRLRKPIAKDVSRICWRERERLGDRRLAGGLSSACGSAAGRGRWGSGAALAADDVAETRETGDPLPRARRNMGAASGALVPAVPPIISSLPTMNSRRGVSGVNAEAHAALSTQLWSNARRSGERVRIESSCRVGFLSPSAFPPPGVSAGRGGSSGPLPLRTIDGVERL
jgi:hypothetical protein